MCRHLAYLGPPIAIAQLVLDAPHCLVEQARAPRHQQSGDANPDGYGIGWWDASGEPRRRRRAEPIWTDTELADELATLRSSAVIAAVRLASPGSPVEVASNAPLLASGWMLSLNGLVDGYHDGVGDELRARVSRPRRDTIEGSADTGVLFALALDRLDAGDSPGTALAGVVSEVERLTTGRLNLLWTDGHRLAATVVGNSLFARHDEGSTTVASEPLDDAPGWRRLADRTLVEGDARSLHERPLPAPGAP